MLEIIAHVFRYPITLEEFKLLENTDVSKSVEATMATHGVDFSDWNWTEKYIQFTSSNHEAAFIDRKLQELFMKESKIVAFNTGREYTTEGQKIACTIRDNRLYFADVSRGIYGVIDNFTADAKNLDRMAYWVMHYYDNNKYMDLSGNHEIRKLLTSAAYNVAAK